jgi:hypothetical protein
LRVAAKLCGIRVHRNVHKPLEFLRIPEKA